MGIFDDIKDTVLDKVDGAKKLLSFFKMFLFVFNCIMFVVYIVSTLVTLQKSDSAFFKTLTVVVLLIYFAALVVFVFLNIRSGKQWNKQLKGYKKGMKAMKLILKTINLLMSIFVIVSASTGDFFSTAWQVFLILVSAFSLFFNIAFFIFMHRWNKRRAKKQASKPQKPKYEDAVPVLPQNTPQQKQPLKKFDFKTLAKNLVASYFSKDEQNDANTDESAANCGLNNTRK